MAEEYYSKVILSLCSPYCMWTGHHPDMLLHGHVWLHVDLGSERSGGGAAGSACCYHLCAQVGPMLLQYYCSGLEMFCRSHC
jgi:hypothetical protein